MADDLIQQFGYPGIFLILVLGGLGLPVPEEAPIIIAAVLARKGMMSTVPALASCFAGVLVGDFVVYFLGYFYGEKVLKLRLTRKFLTREREAQIQGYFHRHGVKILVLGRFAVGFRTAAYLTAGILRLPPLRLFLIDLAAATFSTLLMFGLGWAFADRLEEGLREAKHYIVSAVALGVGAWILHRYVKARLKAGKVIGPPVLVDDEAPLPLPPDDLAVEAAGHSSPAQAEPLPADPTPTPTAEPVIASVVESETPPPVSPPPSPDVEEEPAPSPPRSPEPDARPGRLAGAVGAVPVAGPARFAPSEPG